MTGDAPKSHRRSAQGLEVTFDYDFRLYVSNASPISARAIVNARRFLDDHFAGRYRLAILNIADHVEQARADQIVASPTLLQAKPLPVRRFIGDLSNSDRLCMTMGLPLSKGTA